LKISKWKESGKGEKGSEVRKGKRDVGAMFHQQQEGYIGDESLSMYHLS